MFGSILKQIKKALNKINNISFETKIIILLMLIQILIALLK
ncbi:hypothetical protein [Streptobacillus moniliformis]|nr:hypothetical protein [Streptobacillus moniliformis]